MRLISTGSVSKIAQQYGAEPICTVGVKWTFGSDYTFYSDKANSGNPAKVLSVNAVEDVAILSGSSNATNMTITLDDTDGTIKTIFDNNDIHKRPAAIFQGFDDIDQGEFFLLYEGFIESPIVWSDGDRTVTFTLVSLAEHAEIGFSPEEGQFPNLPTADVGVVWPLAFGNPRHYPGLTYQVVPVGTTLNPFYYVNSNLDIIDPSIAINDKVTYTFSAESLILGGGLPTDTGDALVNELNTIQNQLFENLDSRPPPGTISFVIAGQEYDAHDYALVRTVSQADGGVLPLPQANQSAYASLNDVRLQLQNKHARTDGVQLLNKGYGFPVNVKMNLSMGNHVFTGIMDANGFMTLTEQILPTATYAYSAPQAPFKSTGNGSVSDQYTEYAFGVQQAAFYFTPDGSFTPADYKKMGTPKFSAQGQAPVGYKLVQGLQSDGFQLYDSGSSITIIGDNSVDYIVNTIPTTVTQVYGYKAVGNTKTLVVVPSDRWQHVSIQFGPITAEIVRLNRPLTGYPGEGWDDGIYVDQVSSVGPNPADIMKYCIDTYCKDLVSDFDSFATVKGYLTKYPMNFVYTQRTDIISFLTDVAYQCRCAIYVKNFVVYVKYLSRDPDVNATITEDDILEGTLQVTSSDTEQLVTRLTGTYVADLAKPVQNDVVVRNNIFKYGLFRDSHDFFCYDIAEYVLKTCTYWSIIRSNIWKRVKFSTDLRQLALETYDTVLLDFASPYLANGPVKARVESTQYDSVGNKIDFECWIPVRLGEMEPYPFAYPAGIDVTLFYPTYFADYQSNVYQDFRQDVRGVVATQAGQQSVGGSTYDYINGMNDPGTAGGPTSGYYDYSGDWVPGTDGQGPNGEPNYTRQTSSQGSQFPSDNADQIITKSPSSEDIPSGISLPAGYQPSLKTAANAAPINTLTTPPAGMYPAQIQYQIAGNLYSVVIYINGLDHNATLVQANQLQISSRDLIPNGTWTMVSRVNLGRTATGDGLGGSINFKFNFEHYMQIPIWLA